jgi:hypothetical protein
MKIKITCFPALGVLICCSQIQGAASSYEERAAAIEAQAKAGALAQSHCASTPLSEARSIWDLPEDVKALLERNEVSGGIDEIVDRGEKFNKGDVGGGPFRRFAIAGVSSTCVSVAVEHGGRGYNVRIFAFERNNAQWQGGPIGYTFEPPQSLTALIVALNGGK